MKRTCMIGVLACSSALGQLSFVDATEELGLDGLAGPHCCFVDLNNDGRADAVIGRSRVFLNVVDTREDTKFGFRFVEVEKCGLPAFRRGDIAVFADLDNDGNKDCVWTRYLDVNSDTYEAPTSGPARTAWLKGNGDGTFGQPIGAWKIIDAAPLRTTAAVAVGDVDRDGWLDLYLGNWYVHYGDDLEGYPNDLLLNRLARDDGTQWVRDMGFPRDSEEFDEVHDAAGRPTYGVMIVDLLAGNPQGEANAPGLLDLNYGRRWNRFWVRDPHDADRWRDVAAQRRLDGDAIRHGRYPEWLKERAKTDPRFDREDEKPFRSNGNTFDATVGDIENDGDFDLFFAEIAHAWAGPSSDRSRFLVQERTDKDDYFLSKPALSVDRVPGDRTIHSWNQGDIYAQLADFDLDGRLDLLLCSSDYPDNQRLRLYRQQPDGSFENITSWIGIDHIGAVQPSLADIDGDGDLDILVGQSFNRLRKDQREGRTPRVQLYLNQASDRSLGHSLELHLIGDPAHGISRDALGASVSMTAVIDGKEITQSRQLLGIGGHEGKQMDFVVHFGLGDATKADRIEISWPSRDRQRTVLENVKAGKQTVVAGE